MTLLSAAATTGMLTIGVVSSVKPSAPMYPFAEQIIGRDLYCTKYDILNQTINARRSIEAWRLHHNRVCPHSAMAYIIWSSFGLRERRAVEKPVSMRPWNILRIFQFPTTSTTAEISMPHFLTRPKFWERPNGLFVFRR